MISNVVDINIFKAVLKGFNDFNVDTDKEELEESIWTADRGTNIEKALRSLKGTDCVAHVLQTCLRYTSRRATLLPGPSFLSERRAR